VRLAQRRREENTMMTKTAMFTVDVRDVRFLEAGGRGVLP
jgi:hypothetical protein